jgi:hypothetical protein
VETDNRVSALEHRVKHQFPSLFITLLSVMIGIVLADLVTEARERLALWPLTIDTLRTWGQVTAHGASAVTAWIIYSHLGISHERVPWFADSIVTFVVPLTLLFAMPLIGREEIWPWFYYASASLVISVATSMWLLHLSRAEPRLARLNRLLRTRGYFATFYAGIPVFGVAGWLGQQGFLSDVHEMILAAIPLPTAMFVSYVFLRDWRAAISEPDAIPPAA